MSAHATGDDVDRRIGANECMAVRYLYAAGWSTPEIAAALDYQTVSVANHVREDCRHDSLEEPAAVQELGAEEIRDARFLTGITQEDLAAELGVSASTVSCWETGRNSPRGDTLRRLYDVLEIGEVSAE